jgi:hypothetical protein
MRLRTVILLAAFAGITVSASAMDRWCALSMIESGDNDAAIGSCGEISRFQIRPELWPGGDPENSSKALLAARELMQPRMSGFQSKHRRNPTDLEFYILWNAPWEVDHPSRIVVERARRFANLVHRA